MRILVASVVNIAAIAGLFGAAPGLSAPVDPIDWSNRLTWGVSPVGNGTGKAGDVPGSDRWLAAQLRVEPDALPPDAAAGIAAMRISKQPMADLVIEEDAENRIASYLITDPDRRKAALQAYQNTMNGLSNEAATRSILRDLYSPSQLREQMTWFWFNHFNVQAGKRDIRAMVGDYEDQAIRAHALGNFRDLLEATLKHPAMLRYLDNDQNAVGHINENYARELMELHSMGVGSGYSQKDVQELARILTGVGVNLRPSPKLKPEWQLLYRRDGLFEFNPARHDFGDKQFLGQTIKGSGFAEVEQALNLLAASPATAHHVSEQMAAYFIGNAPPPAVVDRMTAAWKRSNGDIAQVVRAMIRSPEFSGSLGGGFKDPMHFAISSVRLAYGDRVILNAQPILGWLGRMGEGLYARETPDGFPISSAAWTGPGQMAMRFEIARQIGAGSAGLFKAPIPGATDQPAFPQLQNALYFESLAGRLSTSTKTALAQAGSPQEWNALFLSSPEFMRR